MIVLKEFVSMSYKEAAKKHFLNFPGNGCKKEKPAPLLTRLFQIRTIAEKIELTARVLSEKTNPNNRK